MTTYMTHLSMFSVRSYFLVTNHKTGWHCGKGGVVPSVNNYRFFFFFKRKLFLTFMYYVIQTTLANYFLAGVFRGTGFLFVLKIYLFMRERACVGQAEVKGKRISSGIHAEPNAGLEIIT